MTVQKAPNHLRIPTYDYPPSKIGFPGAAHSRTTSAVFEQFSPSTINIPYLLESSSREGLNTPILHDKLPNY